MELVNMEQGRKSEILKGSDQGNMQPLREALRN